MTLTEAMEEFNAMKLAAENLELRRNVLGKDIIPKHVGIIKRLANRISSFVRKHVVKFIRITVFLFA